MLHSRRRDPTHAAVAILIDQSISGSGTAAFTLNTVLTVAVHVTAFNQYANVIDPATNRMLSRCGHLALGVTGAVGTIASATFWESLGWIEWEWGILVPKTPTAAQADHVRWFLLNGVTARMVVSS